MQISRAYALVGKGDTTLFLLLIALSAIGFGAQRLPTWLVADGMMIMTNFTPGANL
jgi:hypothetical protein